MSREVLKSGTILGTVSLIPLNSRCLFRHILPKAQGALRDQRFRLIRLHAGKADRRKILCSFYFSDNNLI
jgi:hypothetical protein